MKSFKLIGLKLQGKTKNENGQSGKDCGELWQKFETEKIAEQIPNKLSDAVYAVYYDYESDEKGLFSYFIGCKVEDNTEKPANLDELTVPEQTYHKETAKGRMTGCITEIWEKIWRSNLNRKFGFDFEVYDERSHNWESAEIDIYLSVKD
ncbi:GyrI-like domain-containing protein [Elizabethkingia anophelis]|uniref:GyrI-like domain-containing protein n=1 Tax=Elizabethkingia anophelis TaxID=1117645 RepID=UPI001F4B5695|nr:GyrI-like domain-containing protein [Elizabethkingia anophelis]MDV3970655.1 AraC family transcriptional regulator [Elizabethkingia anophelis]